MDSSTSTQNVRDVLHGHKVRVQDMGTYEMAQIFFGFISEIKPVLKYLTRFEPLNNELNCHISGSAYRRTDIDLVFPEGISEKTKVLTVDILAQARTDATSVYEMLLITDEGQLLLWSSSYKLVHAGSRGREKHEVANESKFELLDLEKFDRDIQGREWTWKKHPKILLVKALNVIGGLYDPALEKHQDHVRAITQGRARHCEINSRLDFGGWN